jgi:4-amino-4-deoxy-L-arabinose transferase-like glycosyltransferase
MDRLAERRLKRRAEKHFTRSIQMNRPLSAILTTCALLLAAIIISANVVAATYGLDSARMIEAFNLDEGLYLAKMKDNLQRFTLDPDGFFYHGNLYSSIGYYCIAVLERAGWTVNAFLVGFVLRLISIGSGFLAALSLWKFGKICNLPTAIAAGAALALLTMPDFVVFSRTMHPDTLQALFVIVSLGLALLRPTFAFALMSALAAGLAFSTKYIGVLVLPFGFLPLALSTIGRERLSRQVLQRLFLQGLAMIGVFWAAFVLTNPYAAFDRSRFIGLLTWQLKSAAVGYGAVASPNPALWSEPLIAQFGIGGLLYLLGGFVLTCGFLLERIWRGGWRTACTMDSLRTEIILVLYVLAASAHLAISIRAREIRYTYHVVPFLIILSTLAFFKLIVMLMKPIVRPPWIVAAFAASLLVFASTQISFDLRTMAEATTRSESQVIKFGNFVAHRYPAGTKILADSYAYLPPTMTNVTYTNLQTEDLLEQVAPEVLILTRGATGDSIWKQPGTAFSEGKFVKNPHYEIASQVETYLSKLRSTSSDWSVVQENDFEVLLERVRKQRAYR